MRRDGRLPWLRPDAKSQVTLRYANGKPESIDTVVLSTQHAPGIAHKQLGKVVIAAEPDEVSKLESLASTATGNGVPGLRWLSRSEVHAL